MSRKEPGEYIEHTGEYRDRTGDSGNTAPRGDSGPGTPDLAGLITDLALVLADDALCHAGDFHTPPEALTRLRSAIGWTYAQSTEEIAGRLAVALAQAQGEPASRGASPAGNTGPRGDSDPVRQAAQRLTADVITITGQLTPAPLAEIFALRNEIQHAAEIWIESAMPAEASRAPGFRAHRQVGPHGELCWCDARHEY